MSLFCPETFLIERRYIAFHEIYFQSSAGKNEAMDAQEVQISLSHADTHIHSVTSLLFACLYYTQVAMGYIHHVRQEWKKALYLLLPLHTHINTRRDTHREKAVVEGPCSEYQC